MGSSDLDRDGQPIVRAFNAARISDRAIDELIGISRGVLLDGAVVLEEANGLLQWIEANRHTALTWPGDRLYQRLREVLVDKCLDPDEETELVDLLTDLTGSVLPVDKRIASLSTSLPLCRPAPPVVFPGQVFCLTGKFVFGSRKQCEREITQRGGAAASSPSRKTNFLVIGSIGSTDWVHSTHRRKIEEAVELRASGLPLRIVSEEHWVSHLT